MIIVGIPLKSVFNFLFEMIHYLIYTHPLQKKNPKAHTYMYDNHKDPVV